MKRSKEPTHLTLGEPNEESFWAVLDRMLQNGSHD
jgi:hypothetical protein